MPALDLLNDLLTFGQLSGPGYQMQSDIYSLIDWAVRAFCAVVGFGIRFQGREDVQCNAHALNMSWDQTVQKGSYRYQSKTSLQNLKGVGPEKQAWVQWWLPMNDSPSRLKQPDRTSITIEQAARRPLAFLTCNRIGLMHSSTRSAAMVLEGPLHCLG